MVGQITSSVTILTRPSDCVMSWTRITLVLVGGILTRRTDVVSPALLILVFEGGNE